MDVVHLLMYAYMSGVSLDVPKYSDTYHLMSANVLRTQHTVDDLSINSCAYASKYLYATHYWILEIKVESIGSYYWDY